jgi:hypothetical protein
MIEEIIELEAIVKNDPAAVSPLARHRGSRPGPAADRSLVLLREGDPVNVYPFIEAEKAQRRNVMRACVLLRVSRSAFYADRTASPSQR